MVEERIWSFVDRDVPVYYDKEEKIAQCLELRASVALRPEQTLLHAQKIIWRLLQNHPHPLIQEHYKNVPLTDLSLILMAKNKEFLSNNPSFQIKNAAGMDDNIINFTTPVSKTLRDLVGKPIRLNSTSKKCLLLPFKHIVMASTTKLPAEQDWEAVSPDHTAAIIKPGELKMSWFGPDESVESQSLTKKTPATLLGHSISGVTNNNSSAPASQVTKADLSQDAELEGYDIVSP